VPGDPAGSRRHRPVERRRRFALTHHMAAGGFLHFSATGDAGIKAVVYPVFPGSKSQGEP
jgi:hypothetical protein